MVRQYIGARYVPKFMGTYDNTQTYEALCVVDNGLGTSYISKVPTPAGTPLTDTTYWAIYGASSGAIINLQNQIDDMNDGTVAGSLQNQIDEMNDGTVAGSLQNQIDAMGVDVSSYAETDFVIFGDSWCNEGGSHAWVGDFTTRNGLTIHNYSAGGVAYTSPTYSDSIDYHIDAAESDITNNVYDGSKISKVIFFAGLNDFIIGTTAQVTVVKALTCATRAKALYPNAKIIFLLNCCVPTKVVGGVTMRNFAKEFCRRIGTYYPVLTTLTWFEPSDYESDYGHVTADNRNLERNFMLLLKDQTTDKVKYYSTNLPTQADFTGTCQLLITDDGSQLNIRPTNASLAAGTHDIVLPSACLFDRYPAVWGKFIKSDGTTEFCALNPDFTNDKITFTNVNTLIVREIILFYI